MNENESYDVFQQLKELVTDKTHQIEKDEETTVTSLDITDKNGARYGFPVYTKRAIRLKPEEDMIQIDFGSSVVSLRGRNLELLYSSLLADTLSSLTVIDELYDEGKPGSWSIYELVVTESH